MAPSKIQACWLSLLNLVLLDKYLSMTFPCTYKSPSRSVLHLSAARNRRQPPVNNQMKTPQDRFKFLQLIIRILNSMIQLDDDSLFYKNIYCISSNKCGVSNKRCPLIKAPPLAIHTEISTSPLIRPAPMNAALLRTVAIFY